MRTIEEQMRKNFFDHFFNGEEVQILEKTHKKENRFFKSIKRYYGLLFRFVGR
jgi:hypothetical protein